MSETASYFKIPADSNAGRKFDELFAKCDEVNDKINTIGERVGFNKWYHSVWDAVGFFGAQFPEDDPDPTLWKPEKGYGYRAFSPRCGNKNGKALYAELKACGSVGRDEFNKVMGHRDIMSNVGVCRIKDGFAVAMYVSAKDEIPPEAVEITGSEYDKLTKNE